MFEARFAPLVALGGAVGASIRWGLGQTALDAAEFPWATFAANVVGCALLGWVIERGGGAAKASLGAGFCGGLTTFSTFAVEVVILAESDDVGSAAAYLVLSLATGLVALQTARNVARRT